MPSREATSKKVLIVDDHPIVRRGLRELLEGEAGFEVSAEAASEAEALEAAGREPTPDLALVDVNLQNGDGIGLAKQLRSYHEKLPVLIVSMHDETLYAERALAAGARGYIMKQAPDEEMLEAVRRLADGRFYVSGDIRERLFPLKAGEVAGADGNAKNGADDGASPVGRLSDRELEVFLLVSRGYAPRHIAEELNLSVKTIETHRRRICQKIDLDGAAELTRYAVAWSREEARQGDGGS